MRGAQRTLHGIVWLLDVQRVRVRELRGREILHELRSGGGRVSEGSAYYYEAGYQNGLRASTDELKAENAKLRELVSELWSLAYGYVPFEAELDDARDMIRELGIEVD